MAQTQSPTTRYLAAAVALGGTLLALFFFWQGRAQLLGSGDWPTVILSVYPHTIAVLSGSALLGGVFGYWKSRQPRRALLVAGILSISAALLLTVGFDPARMVFRTGAMVVAALLMLSALGFGAALLQRLDRKAFAGSPAGTFSLRCLLLAFGLGLIVLSTLTVLAGLAGALSVLWVVPPVGVILAIRSLRPLRKSLWPAVISRLQEAAILSWVCGAVVVAGLLLLLPTVYLPPLDYDVLEYHAQLPKEYLALGSVRVLPHNIFSGFPQQMEMLTLLCFTLVGEGLGVATAKILHFSFLPVLLLGMGALARALVPALKHHGGGALAALLALSLWATPSLASKLYVEVGFAAFLVLAVLALVSAHEKEPAESSGFSGWRYAVAGLCAGGAAACKYPGLLFVGLPVVLGAAFISRGQAWPQRWRRVLLVGGLCGLVLAPYLLRNLFATGNPVFPLMNQHFAVADWTPAQAERFRQAHRPGWGLQPTRHEERFSLKEGLWQIRRIFLGGRGEPFGQGEAGAELGALALVFLAGWVLRPSGVSSHAVAGLLVWVAGAFLIWFFLTHRVERFLYPPFLLLCVLSGAGYGCLRRSEALPVSCRSLPVALAGGAVLMALLNLAVPLGTLYQEGEAGKTDQRAVLLGQEDGAVLLQRYYNPWPLRQALASLPPESRVLMVGAADPFWLPAERVGYAVVFSPHSLWQALEKADTPAALAAELRAHGYTHLYIHWPELARLRGTYHEAYPLDATAQRRLAGLVAIGHDVPLPGVAQVTARQFSDMPYGKTLLLSLRPFWELRQRRGLRRLPVQELLVLPKRETTGESR